MIELKFNSNALYQDLVNMVLIPSANEAIQRVYDDIAKGLKSAPNRRRSTDEDVQMEEARYNQIESQIVAEVATYGWAILESYGTGPKIDAMNPDLGEYIRSNLWNPLRKSFEIVGREEGNYTDFFGETRESKGTRAGKGIGGWGKGITPNYTIQNAEKRLEQGVKSSGFVQRIIDTKTEQFFDTVDLDKYFVEVTV